MSAGDVIQPTIVRISSNERADTIDVNALAQSVRTNIDAVTRTALITPRNTNGTAVGTILTGLSLTLNPVPADGKVRINSELGIAIDSDGRYVIKPAGTTVDVVVPAGGTPYQIYLYAKDDLGASDQRRFIPVTAPYTEYGRAVETTSVGSYGVHYRAGNLASTVKEDSVGGRTRALVLLCVATNTAGTITVTGYHAVNAPNGTDGVNRLSTVTAPSSVPTTPYTNASWRAFDDKTNSALYELGQAKYRNSQTLTPSAANNYGAYTPLAYGGIDLAVRRHGPVITIGKDSEGTYGDISLDNYVSADLAIAAAIALLPTNGGTIHIKTNSVLTMAGNVTIPADKSVRFRGGALESVDGTMSYIDMVTYKFVCASGSASTTTLVFENMSLVASSASATGTFVELHDRWQLVVRDSSFSLVSTYSGASPTRIITWNAATTVVGDVRLVDSYLHYTTASTSVGGGIIGSALAHTGNVAIVRCALSTAATGIATLSHRLVYFADLRDNFLVSDCRIFGTGTSSGPFSNQGHYGIYINTTDNTARVRTRRIIQNCQFLGRTSGGLNPTMVGIFVGDVANVRIINNDFADMVYGVVWTTTGTYTADLVIEGNNFDTMNGTNILCTVATGTTATGLRVNGNTFRNTLSGGEVALRVYGNAGSGTIAAAFVRDNVCVDATMSFQVSMTNCTLEGNHFTRSAATTYANVLHLGQATSYSLTNVTVQRNRFKGCQYPTGNTQTQAGVAIMVYASAVRDMSIDDNHFEDCENIAYSGGGTMSHSIIRVLTDSVTGLSVNSNKFYNITQSLSGAGARIPQAIALGSSTWGTADAGQWDGVEVCNNVCSDILSRFEPIVIYWISTIINLVVADNAFSFDGITSTYTYGSFAIGGAGTYRNIVITGNAFRYTGSGGAAMNFNVMTLAGTFHNVGILGNRWSCTSSFGHSSGYGLAWGSASLYGLNFDNNAFMCDGDTTVNSATKFSVVDPLANTSNPSFPAGTNYYGGSNINVYNP